MRTITIGRKLVLGALAIFAMLACALVLSPLAYGDMPDVKPAPLVDWGADGTAQDVVTPGDYQVTVSECADEDADFEVTVTATGLVSHYNSQGTKAYWVGIGVPHVEGNTYAQCWWDDRPTGDDADYFPPDSFIEDGAYATLYWGRLEGGYFAGNRAVGCLYVKDSSEEVTTYKLDFSGVKFAADVVPAPLADHGTTPETPIEPDTYTVVSAPSESDGYDYDVTVTADAIPAHFNTQPVKSYWVGIAIPKFEGQTYAVGWSSNPDGLSESAPDGEFEKDGKQYVSFYWGSGKGEPFVASPFTSEKAGVLLVKNADEDVVASYKIDFSNVVFKRLAISTANTEHGHAQGLPEHSEAGGAYEGEKVQITNDPDEGYVMAAVTVTQTDGTQTVEVAEDGTFIMPAFPVTISATFEPTFWTVSYDKNGYTFAEWPDSATVEKGQPLATANPGKPDNDGQATGNSHAVSYDPNGGSCDVRGDTSEELHAFTGGFWYDAASDGSLVANMGDSYTPEADQALYASYTDTPTWSAVVLPDASWKGHQLDGWFDAAEGGQKVGLPGDSYTPQADVTLYAHWTTLPAFTDVDSTTDHADDIQWLADNGISTGWVHADGTAEFRPYSDIARADMAAFLYRLGEKWGLVDSSWTPTDADKAKFSDVSDDKASANYVEHAREVWWLGKTGISRAFPDGTFRPNSPVARQDMAAFMFRIAELANRGGASESWTATDADKAKFSDVDGEDADNHHNEVWWLAATGVSIGFPDGTFRGMSNVVRCDMAAFMHKLDALPVTVGPEEPV